VAGLRDDDGIVHELKLFPVKELSDLRVVSFPNICTRLRRERQVTYANNWLLFTLLFLNFRNGHPTFVSSFWNYFWLKWNKLFETTNNMFLFLSLIPKRLTIFPKTFESVYKTLGTQICICRISNKVKHNSEKPSIYFLGKFHFGWRRFYTFLLR